MDKLAKISILMLFCGCQVLSHKPAVTNNVESLNRQARESLVRGEYFKARKAAEKALLIEPENAESRQLMAEVLDGEISRQKEAFDSRPADEGESGENDDQVKTWLERGRELYRAKQYEEAMAATEKVFTYDENNIEASELMDQIRKAVYSEGKTESIFLKKMYETEADERIVKYKNQVKKQIEAGEWGTAKLTVEKILLLSPEDKEARNLYEQIQKREALNS